MATFVQSPLPRVQKSAWLPEGTPQTFVGCMDAWVESQGTSGSVIWENVILVDIDLEGVERTAGKDLSEEEELKLGPQG